MVDDLRKTGKVQDEFGDPASGNARNRVERASDDDAAIVSQSEREYGSVQHRIKRQVERTIGIQPTQPSSRCTIDVAETAANENFAVRLHEQSAHMTVHK